MSKQRWEYKIVSQVIDKTYCEQMLNENGAEGWELVAIIKSQARPTVGEFIFKRPQ